MKQISRKQFLVNSTVLATLSPLISLLPGCSNENGGANLISDIVHIGNASFDKGLRYLDDNGAYLYFYFIGAIVKGGNLVPEKENTDAYLIVQILPQSLHEPTSLQAPTGQLNARLAKPSFLAFKLWPGVKNDKRKQKMDFSFEQLLNWENPEQFRLLTTGDINPQRFNAFNQRTDVTNAVVQLDENDTALVNYNGLEYYKLLLSKLFQDLKNAPLPLISIFEIPAQLLTVLHVRDKGVQARVLQNKYKLSRARYRIEKDDQIVARTVLERWSARVIFQEETKITSSFIPFETLPPVLRAIGLRSKKTIPDNTPVKDDCKCQSNEDPDGYLPTLLDNYEIVFLNQLGKVEFADEGHDLRIGSRDENEHIHPSPFLISALGATVKLNYFNLKPPSGMSLVEYEHHFQDGRDNYIRVARIGVCTPSCERTVHVKVAKRKIGSNGKSFMEMKHYVKTVKEYIKFPMFEEQSTKLDTDKVAYLSLFKNIADDGADPSTYATNKFRLPFSQITALFNQSPPIRPPSAPDAMGCSCDQYFWVYKENTLTDSYQDLMMLPFQYVDRTDNVHKKENPVFFMRKDFLEDVGKVKALLGYTGGVPSIFAQFENDPRFRIYFDNQPVSFTPDPSVSGVNGSGYTEVADADKNRINHSPTEWIEYYFDVASLIANPEDVFNEVPLVIYTQMRRAKINPEQFEQYRGEKTSSLVKYHDDYLQFRFNESNKAKLIFHHRKDFMQNSWQKFSGDVAAVTDALDSKFERGYEKIQNLFSNAGNRIGALINPDIQIERFALVKQAFTLPDTVNQQWANLKQRPLKVAEILKGRAAQLFNGISFLSILKDVIDGNKSPLVTLKKISGELEAVDAFIRGAQSSLVRKVFQSVQSVNDDLLIAQSDIKAAQQKIDNAKAQVLDFQQKLYKKVPDYTSVKTAVQRLFEARRIAFTREVQRIETTIYTFIANEFAVLMRRRIQVVDAAKTFEDQCKDHWEGVKEHYLTSGKGLVARLTDRSANVEVTVQQDIKIITDVLTTDIKNLVVKFKGLIPDILSGKDIPVGNNDLVSLRIHFNKEIIVQTSGSRFVINPSVPDARLIVDWEKLRWESVDWAASRLDHLENWGTEQLQQLDIQLNALEDTAITGRAAVIADVKTRLTAAAQKIDTSLYQLAIGYRDKITAALNRIQSLLDTEIQKLLHDLLSLLDLLCQCTPSYYYFRFLQLKKDYNDIVLKLQAFAGLLPAYESVKADARFWIETRAMSFNTEQEKFADAIRKKAEQNVITYSQRADAVLDNLEQDILTRVTPVLNGLPDVKGIKASLDKELQRIKTEAGNLSTALTRYEDDLKRQATGTFQDLQTQFNHALASVTDLGEIRQARKEFDELLRLYTAVKRQEFSYQWEIDEFRSANIKILRFNPQLESADHKTTMTVRVHSVIYFDPLHAPDVIERVESYIENRISNFTITFLSVLSVGFNEARFVSGTGIPTHTSVSIRDIKFEGPLSFIQKLEELLQSLGEGFHLELTTSHVALSYVLAIPTISTPTFSFANFSIGVGVKIYFNNQPMAIQFSLAEPERKATIAAGIFGGCFFARFTAEPKNGIREIEMALEMGVYLGISIGPIHGEVRLMVGLYFQKDPSGVVLEGYLVAEGTLSIWIISATARLYMGVRSQNSSVEGECSVTLTIKIGFFEKSFSGSYRKQVKGAENNNRQNSAFISGFLAADREKTLQRFSTLTAKSPIHDLFYISLSELIDVDEYQPLSGDEWRSFYTTFYQ